MSEMHVEYYVVSPRSELGVLAERGNKLAAFLSRKPLLWRSKLPHLKRPGDSANLARLKILFVLEIWSSYEGDEWLREFDVGGALSLATFDRWWVIEPIEFPETAEAVERGIPVAFYRDFADTGIDWVDEWLGSMRNPRT